MDVQDLIARVRVEGYLDVRALSVLRRHQGHLERVMVYYNPAKAQTNRQVREGRLSKAEAELAKIENNLRQPSVLTTEQRGLLSAAGPGAAPQIGAGSWRQRGQTGRGCINRCLADGALTTP